jgi:hypothetical protein
VTQGEQGEVGRGGQSIQEPKRMSDYMLDYEKIAKMPLESLLYYILVGEGRRRIEVPEG